RRRGPGPRVAADFDLLRARGRRVDPDGNIEVDVRLGAPEARGGGGAPAERAVGGRFGEQARPQQVVRVVAGRVSGHDLRGPVVERADLAVDQLELAVLQREEERLGVERAWQRQAVAGHALAPLPPLPVLPPDRTATVPYRQGLALARARPQQSV